jgi:hypothetical protein
VRGQIQYVPDNTPPVVTCPGPVTVSSQAAQTTVSFGSASAVHCARLNGPCLPYRSWPHRRPSSLLRQSVCGRPTSPTDAGHLFSSWSRPRRTARRSRASLCPALTLKRAPVPVCTVAASCAPWLTRPKIRGAFVRSVVVLVFGLIVWSSARTRPHFESGARPAQP